MSLDVYLTVGGPRQEPCECCNGTGKVERGPDEVYSANVTHNLTEMAAAASIYEPLWRPDEIGVTKAGELVEPLRKGLETLRSNPIHFRQFDAKNGWGTYEHFVPFVERYLEACEQNPDADVSVSR